jgi:Tfp pilus assembly protein PilF
MQHRVELQSNSSVSTGNSGTDGAAGRDQLFREAWQLIRGHVLLSDRHDPWKPRWLIRKRLMAGAELLARALKIEPKDWRSMWSLGKIYQRLGDQSAALRWFTLAAPLEEGTASSWREASLCALDLGEGTAALTFAKRALMAEPQDPGLLANYALALLVSGDDSAAASAAESAVALARRDPVTQTVLRLVASVAQGKRPRPKRIPIRT